MAKLESKLKTVVGDRTAIVLEEELGLISVADLLRHYPRRFAVRGELTEIEKLEVDEEVTILGKVEKVSLKRIPGRKGGILEVVVTDGKAKLTLTFFNQAWRSKELREGREGLFSGKVGIFKGKRQLTHPDYLLIPDGDDATPLASDFAGKFIPVYRSTRKMPSWKIAQCVRLAIDSIGEIPEPIPREILERLKLPNLSQALRDLHNPSDLEVAERARARLTFDEALLMQLFLVQRKQEIRSQSTKIRAPRGDGLLALFDQGLPFELTGGQLRVWNEIAADISKAHPMYRLLQGDVGSGKTIVALRAMLAIVDAGGQAALLAPTEVLAQQHFKNFANLLGELAMGGMLGGTSNATRMALLTGSLSATERRAIQSSISSGDVGIVVGTHALLSEGVDFKDLGLVVIDEQHRFGVEQRDALRSKADSPPHILVMTATPIPRTIAMTVFGDLDTSILDELPLDRSPIASHVIATKERPQFLERAWQRAREEVAQGHQVYIVAPRISPSDTSDFSKFGMSQEELRLARRLSGESEEIDSKDMNSVEDLLPKLNDGPLNGLRLAKLHGRMASEEKEAVMSQFSAGQIDVLVTTTVIEVGVDVPNASMMIIMDADRFGVSQLHQLRGRVGRGSVPGLCLFVTDQEQTSSAMVRLNAVASTTNGFELSKLDLEQRREGDVLGSAQSGATSHLRLLRVIRDETMIAKAREIAEEVLAGDPKLEKSPELAAEVDKLRQEERASYLEKN
jgi:ATP-dependent DNA helicase RecG